MTSKADRVAVFGGTFDPPHIGHVAFCQALAAEDCFDRVWILPAYVHPFGKEMAPFRRRLAMCGLAFAALSAKVEVRDDEERFNRSGFTIDLLRSLKSRFPARRFTLALGSDNYEQRHRWKDYDELKRLVEIRFFGRRGWEEQNEALGREAPFPRASSTEIRRVIAEGGMPAHLVPPGVAEYIIEHGLYKGARSAR